MACLLLPDAETLQVLASSGWSMLHLAIPKETGPLPLAMSGSPHCVYQWPVAGTIHGLVGASVSFLLPSRWSDVFEFQLSLPPASCWDMLGSGKFWWILHGPSYSLWLCLLYRSPGLVFLLYSAVPC